MAEQTLAHQCFHCLRDFHDGPLTAFVSFMWDNHVWEEDYDPVTDLTHIVCLGSDAIGPARPLGIVRRGFGMGISYGHLMAQMQQEHLEHFLQEEEAIHMKAIKSWIEATNCCEQYVPKEVKCEQCCQEQLPDITPGTPDTVIDVAGVHVFTTKKADGTT